jgi:abhydrolase domain-containing protein 6
VKRFGFLLLALVLVGAVWIAATYPAIGELTYTQVGAAEARLYGFRTETVDIGELRISTYQGGPADAKEAIVLLHGYSADKNVWPRFAKYLVKDYRVIIPDLAGHGETGFDEHWDYSAPAQARRVALMLDRLGIEKVHVAGNSMGGFISAHFALAYPARTLSTTMIDPAGVTPPMLSDMQKMLAQGRNPFEVSSREDFDSFYAMTMASPPWLPGFVLAAMAKKYEARRPELAQIFRGFHEHDQLDSRLAEIQAPALVIWGSEDRLIHVSGAQIWAKGLPHAQLIVEEGIGHMPMVERPAETAQFYRQFLANPVR